MDKFITYLKNNIKDYVPKDKTVDLQGWMDQNVKHVFELTDISFMIEVGTWKGRCY